MTQMPSWSALPLGIVLAVWSLGVGVGCNRHFARLWFSPGSGGWRTAGRVLLIHGVLVTLILTSVIVTVSVRDATTYRTWPLGALLVVTLGLLGPIVASVVPTQSGLSPDRETLARAGAEEPQARVVRWLGAPFAVVEMSMLIAACFAALAA